MQHTRTRLVVSILTLCCGAGTLMAGPLTPPAGPVAATSKPLGEIEPRIAVNSTNTPGDSVSIFRITQPGSYYLTANVQGVSGKSGIDIAASNVTIDLNGFAVIGNFASNTLSGIRIAVNSPEDVTVKNGTVERWGIAGIDLFAGTPTHVKLQDVRSHNNANQGFRLNNGAVAVACISENNGGIGFDTFDSVSMTHCIASSNGGNGIDTASNNNVLECHAFGNLGTGINANSGTTVSGCTVSGNFRGGIMGNGSMIRECNATNNSSFGIAAVNQCVLHGNICGLNSAGSSGTGPGILVIGSRNRVEENACDSNVRGIQVDSPQNILVRNSCSGNSGFNWSIVPNNVFGPIVDRTSVVSGNVLGNSAASTLGTTDANANFSH